MTFHTWGNSIWNSKEVMRLTSRGRLGINTTSPTELLDVNGNIKCTGTITNGANSYMYAGGLRINGNDPNTLYNETRVLGITALNSINFITGTTLANYATRMSINTSGNVLINNGLLTINAADWGNSGTKGIIFRNGYDIPNNNNHNCSILTYDHDGQGFSDGLSINAFDGISFCTGSNTRAEKMRLTSEGNVNISGSIFCGGNLTCPARIKGAQYICTYGDTIAYNYNWNSTGLQGWFIVLNDFWSGNNNNGGCAYLTIAIYLVNTSQFCCFCRVLVNAGGGAGTIIIDSKNPTSGVYEFFLSNVWDSGGTNALRVRTSTPGVIVENLRYKVYG
jgi:hypothetical protein